MNTRISRSVCWSVLALALAPVYGCSSSPVSDSDMVTQMHAHLPEPDLKLNIAGLGPCDDNPDRSLQLNSQHPVNVLVHGCYGSAGRFRMLSQVLAFHGQQSVCFSYNDRDSMMLSSRQLADAVEQLGSHFDTPQITILGYSQGGLVARKALVTDRSDPVDAVAKLRLVTVASPLSGINASRHCANPLLRVITLGLHDAACWIISGDKWYEITPASDFIRQPGALNASVENYLQVSTDETGSCRRLDDEHACIEDDFVFTLEEQALPAVNVGTIATNIEVKAGHIEIVGGNGIEPVKLIQVLQQQGYLHPTDPSRTALFKALLAQLYGKHR